MKFGSLYYKSATRVCQVESCHLLLHRSSVYLSNFPVLSLTICTRPADEDENEPVRFNVYSKRKKKGQKMITIGPYASDSSRRYKTKQCVLTPVWCAHTSSNNQRKPIANPPSLRYVMRLRRALKRSRKICITTHTARKRSTCDEKKGRRHTYQSLYDVFACISCPPAALKLSLRYSAHQNYMTARYAVAGDTASVAFTCDSLAGSKIPTKLAYFFALFIPLPIDLPKCGRREPNPRHGEYQRCTFAANLPRRIREP